MGTSLTSKLMTADDMVTACDPEHIDNLVLACPIIKTKSFVSVKICYCSTTNMAREYQLKDTGI